MAKRILLSVLAILAAGIIAFVALSWRPAVEPIEPPDRAAFDDEMIRRGAELAAIGDCAVCHTAEGGEPYAGGFPVPTPFGIVYATNITPDPETGIGRWSEEAFIRSMREGVARDGSHLYPAFPYTHYTRATDEDLRALHAFLMTREPVRAEAPDNELAFPLEFRPLVAGWKLLFLEEGVYQPVAGESEAWNRGAYLVTGLGHCGSCHTPRNALGAEREDERLNGGEGEGWHGPALNANSPALIPWTEEALFRYMREGFDRHHGAALGPMAEVVNSLAGAPDEDIRAMATYLASLAPSEAAEREVEGALQVAQYREFGVAPTADEPETTGSVDAANAEAGHEVFAGSCAICHHQGGRYPFTRPVELALSSSVTGPDPRNLIHIIMKGVEPPEGERGLIMPGYAAALTDAQVTALVEFVRDHFSEEPPWEEVEETVRRIRGGEETS